MGSAHDDEEEEEEDDDDYDDECKRQGEGLCIEAQVSC